VSRRRRKGPHKYLVFCKTCGRETWHHLVMPRDTKAQRYDCAVCGTASPIDASRGRYFGKATD
jgi:uncharacterized Zn finger protein